MVLARWYRHHGNDLRAKYPGLLPPPGQASPKTVLALVAETKEGRSMLEAKLKEEQRKGEREDGKAGDKTRQNGAREYRFRKDMTWMRQNRTSLDVTVHYKKREAHIGPGLTCSMHVHVAMSKTNVRQISNLHTLLKSTELYHIWRESAKDM